MFSNKLNSFLAVGLLLAAHSIQAAELEPNNIPDQGFSYFMGLGQLNSTYQESISILPVKSKAQSSNLILITGALYVLNEDYMLSLDSLSTFYPGTTTESWNSTSPTFNGINLTSSILQQNSFSLSVSNTLLALHKRIDGDWFLFGGPSFGTNSFKRYAFVQGPDKAVAITNATVEESSSEVLANFGIALESAQVRNAPSHYSLRASVAAPLWRQLQNTSYPSQIFSSAKGYDIAVEGRYSWAIHQKVHLGTWLRLARAYRGNQITGKLEMPANTLTSAGYGLELLWKL